MTIRLNFRDDRGGEEARSDLQALLHPAGAFGHPEEVAHDPDLTLNEKRAILASWASDACAVESAPALRVAGAGSPPVTFDDVIEALRALDEEAKAYGQPKPHYRRVLGKTRGAPGQKPTPSGGDEGGRVPL